MRIAAANRTAAYSLSKFESESVSGAMVEDMAKTADAKNAVNDAAEARPPVQGVPSGWREVEDLPIIGWAEVPQGQLIKGKLLAMRPAGKGNVIDLEIDGEPFTYGCPKVLERKLTGALGREVGIVCLGMTMDTDNGKAWDFRVFVNR